LDQRCLVFDATNFFTFLDSFNLRSKLPQRGHSKEGRDNRRLPGLAFWSPPTAEFHCCTTPMLAINPIR
jgi:hypothetical protein